MRIEVELDGRIDANNVKALESRLDELLEDHAGEAVDEVVFRAENLKYISSAGLRALLRCRKRVRRAAMIDVSPEIYDILETTGFTEILDVRKAFPEFSVDGLEMIGSGANGEVYRVDEDKVIKVYNPLTNPPEKILREKEAARKAFVHGIPSAISYDIVKVGDRCGMIYEMIHASTLGQEAEAHPEELEEYAYRMAMLLKQLHNTEFEPGELPDARLGLQSWADVAERSGCYSAEVIDEMRRIIRYIPARNTFVHGDFHPGNIMVSEGELVLIDMGDASLGDPLIDLLGSYQIMKMAGQRRGGAERYTGMSAEHLEQFWNHFIRNYAGIMDNRTQEEYERKLRAYALLRSLPGVTFSEVVPDEIRPKLIEKVTEEFLSDATQRIYGYEFPV